MDCLVEFHVAEKAWVFSSRRVRRLCMSLKWRWVVQNSIGIGAEIVVHVWQYTIFSRVHLRANNEMVCCLLASLFGFCVALFVGLSVCFGLVCLLVGLVWFSLVWFVRWLVWSVLVWCSLVCFACCLVLFWLIICFFWCVCLFCLFGLVCFIVTLFIICVAMLVAGTGQLGSLNLRPVGR